MDETMNEWTGVLTNDVLGSAFDEELRCMIEDLNGERFPLELD